MCLAEDRFRSRILQMRSWPEKQHEWEAAEAMQKVTVMGCLLWQLRTFEMGCVARKQGLECAYWWEIVDGKWLAISGFWLSRVVPVKPQMPPAYSGGMWSSRKLSIWPWASSKHPLFLGTSRKKALLAGNLATPSFLPLIVCGPWVHFFLLFFTF